MDDLVAFVRRCVDEDERVAREAPGPAWVRAIERDGEPGKWRGVKAQLVTLPPDKPHPLVVGTEVARSDHYWVAEHIALWDPARVLAEVEAKRRILDLHAPLADYKGRVQCEYCAGLCHSRSGLGCDDPADAMYPCETVVLLAQPYAGHDGWREEWRAAR